MSNKVIKDCRMDRTLDHVLTMLEVQNNHGLASTKTNTRVISLENSILYMYSYSMSGLELTFFIAILPYGNLSI